MTVCVEAEITAGGEVALVPSFAWLGSRESFFCSVTVVEELAAEDGFC